MSKKHNDSVHRTVSLTPLQMQQMQAQTNRVGMASDPAEGLGNGTRISERLDDHASQILVLTERQNHLEALVTETLCRLPSSSQKRRT